MPSTEKLLHFLSSSLICAAGVCLLGFGMSTDWAAADMTCGPIETEEFNGSSSLEIGLFNGTEFKINCPRISKLGIKVPVFDRLGKIAGAPIILHALVVILLGLALLGSAGSILVSLYNSFSNPYQTLKVGFFLLIPYICFNMVSILMVYLYVHTAYTRRKEQEKPTEDAPKEIMMY